MKIVDFSLRKRVTIAMVVMVIVILGFISYSKLGLDMLPDLEYPYISIVTNYSGVSSQDIEQNVTRPVEQWVSTVSGVKQVRSISQEGQSIVMVEFNWGTNLDFAAQDIRDTIGLFENFLPKGAQKPLVMKFNFANMPVLGYGITAEGMELKKLRDYIDGEVATRLERIDGVASAIVFSPEEGEVLVNVDKGRLESRGLSIQQVEAAIQASNINLPAGFINETHHEYLLRTIGEFKRVAEIRDIVVGMGRQGGPVFLRDIAEVRDSVKEVRSILRLNGQNGIMLMVTKSSGANSVLVARAVKRMLADIQPHLGHAVRFHVFFDLSRIIEITAAQSTSDILLGGLLAMAIIWAFLRNFRPTLAIGIAIPLSIIVTFIAFHLMGYTLNIITLGGLALGVGMLVDNAIVVIENIFRHLGEGKSAFDAARVGTSEVGVAITAGTLTHIAVFFPMIFASGVAGKLSQGLALSVSFSILASLFVALTIIPMMASWIFRTQRRSLVAMGSDAFCKYRAFYEGWLRRALHRRKWVVIGTVVLFLAALVGVAFLGKEFMPPQDNAMIYLKLTMPVGTNTMETDRIVRYLEKQALRDPAVITTFVQIGTNEQNAQDAASGTNPSGSYEGALYAYLKTSSERELSDRQILEQWRRAFPELENGRIAAIDLAAASMTGESAAGPIECNIYGKDLEKLELLAERIRRRIVDVSGIRDVKISLDKSKPEISIRIRKEEASKLGLSTYDISHQIQTFTIGTVVSRMILEGEDRDIRVRLREEDRRSLAELRMLPIQTPSGAKVYLSQVADLEGGKGPVRIDRENRVRKVSVTANYIGTDLGSIVREIMKRTDEIAATMPQGYFFEMGGQYQDMIEAFQTMALALLLSIILVYAVMASLYENLKYPFIIMFTIPLGFIGVVLLMALTGKEISLPSFMGFIMLGGIVVNNGIVMVDYINRLIAAGSDRFEAVVHGAVTRLRPILITSLTTILGMLPMAVSAKEGSEMRSPMAIALIGGLGVSTLFTLFFIPVLYSYFSRIPVHSAAPSAPPSGDA